MPLPDEGASAEENLFDTPSQYSPFDPEAVQPKSSVPPLSDEDNFDAPDVGDTSGEDGEPGETPPQDEQAEKKIEFDPRYRDAFEGLLFLGALQDSFELWTHEFVVRTLTTEEMAEIALIVKPYVGTNMEVGVYQTAVVAAALVTVDGRALPDPIERGDSGLRSTKYPYVAKRWYPAVREKIYQRIYALEVEVRRVLDEMEKASG